MTTKRTSALHDADHAYRVLAATRAVCTSVSRYSPTRESERRDPGLRSAAGPIASVADARARSVA